MGHKGCIRFPGLPPARGRRGARGFGDARGQLSVISSTDTGSVGPSTKRMHPVTSTAVRCRGGCAPLANQGRRPAAPLRLEFGHERLASVATTLTLNFDKALAGVAWNPRARVVRPLPVW